MTMDRASLEVLSFNGLKKKLMDLDLPAMADQEKYIDALADLVRGCMLHKHSQL